MSQTQFVIPTTNGAPSPVIANIPNSAPVVVNRVQPQMKTPSRASGLEWIIMIIIFILIIGIIVWMIWYFGFRSIGKPPGHSCSANSDCEIGTYCSGNGLCVPGEGDREGDRCDITGDCVIGLVCDSDTNVCTRTNSPL